MSDEVEPAGPQLICQPGECERSILAYNALKQIRQVWASDLNASDALDEIEGITADTLDILESI